jgi:hypothetical protein
MTKRQIISHPIFKQSIKNRNEEAIKRKAQILDIIENDFSSCGNPKEFKERITKAPFSLWNFIISLMP